MDTKPSFAEQTGDSVSTDSSGGTEKVKELISMAEQDINSTESEIALLQVKLEQQKLYLEQLKEKLTSHRRLPPEVLAVIFEHTLPTIDGVAYLPIPVPKKHLAIRQVSKRWRAAALDYPRLRNHIWLSDSSLEALNRVAPAVIPQEGHLSFYLHGTTIWLHAVYETFLPAYSNQIRWIKLSCRQMAYLQVFSKPMSERFPHLQRMDLDTSIDIFSLPIEIKYRLQGLDPFEGGTTVKQLSLHNQVWPMFKPVFLHKFPWYQLTDLSLEGDLTHEGNFDCDTLLPLLQKCQNLRRCQLILQTEKLAPNFTPEKRVVLPRLTELKITIFSPAPFECLTLPSLTDLFIVRACTLPVQSLVALFARSSCSLRAFREAPRETISGVDPALKNCPAMDECLALFDCLRNVRQLHTHGLNLAALEQIAAGTLFPSLHSLRVGECNHHFLSPGDIVRALCNRLGGGKVDQKTAPASCSRIYSLHIELGIYYYGSYSAFERFFLTCAGSYNIDLVLIRV